MPKSHKNSVLLSLDESTLSLDLISLLTQEERARTILLLTDKVFYKKIKSDGNLKGFKNVVLISKFTQDNLEKALSTLDKESISSLALFNMNLEKVNSSLDSTEETNFLLDYGLHFNLLLGNYFKGSIINNRGKILLPIYYYKNEILMTNGLYAGIYTALERYYQSLSKSMLLTPAKVEILYIKAPSEYTLLKYKNILKLIQDTLYQEI